MVHFDKSSSQQLQAHVPHQSSKSSTQTIHTRSMQLTEQLAIHVVPHSDYMTVSTNATY